jgi:hypothetical protein
VKRVKWETVPGEPETVTLTE